MAERGNRESPGGDGRAARAAALPFDFSSILAIADSLPVMVAYVDADQIYRFCNRPIADWFERPRDQILGRSVREVMGEATYEMRRAAIEAAIGGERQWFAASFDHPTRGHLTTQAEYIPHVASDGRVSGVVMVVEDLTEQRAAEVALRESEARFRRIANSAPAPMWVTRLDGTRDFVNEAYSQFFGFPAGEIRQHDWKKGLHPDDFDRFVGDYERALTTGETMTLEGRFRRFDGEWRWLRAVAQPRKDVEGNTIGFIGVASDITEAKTAELELRDLVDARTAELKSAQDQLRQSQKMEALGQLTGGIAHDFNNLLTVVVGGLDLINRSLEDPRLKRFAQNALEAAERGARLTGQLLAFSRTQRLEVKPMLIAPLIEQARPLLRNVLGPGIEKTIHLDEERIPVMADATQVEVALLNLTINARDAMPGGGKLTIVTRGTTIDDGDPELEPGDYLELCIADTGAGMSEEVRARAFEPFFTTKEVGKGTGLGLSMVYGMVRQSGGTVRIESEAGKGTAVRLYFRRADGDEDLAEGDGAASARHDGERDDLSVLVIDDDPDVRAFIVSSLIENGYRVREAADGEEGIAAFRAERPDVIVVDYFMPGMTGAQVADCVLAEAPDQKLLFVSGYSETDEIARAAPGATLLAKPFRPDALDRAVREVAGR